MENKTPIRRRAITQAPLFSSMGPMFGLRRDLNQLFDGIFNDWLEPSANQKPIESWGNFVPKLNVEDRENELLVTAEVPGMTSDDLDISLADGVLTIKGHKKEDYDKTEGKVHYVGRSYGEFQQSIPLNTEVNEDAVEASAQNGVLTLRLPKREPTKERVRKINVKAK